MATTSWVPVSLRIAPELGVLSVIDNAHATPAELFEDAVMGNGLADEVGRVGHARDVMVYRR